MTDEPTTPHADPAPPPAHPPPASTSPPVPAAARGATVVAERVVGRVAARAAEEAVQRWAREDRGPRGRTDGADEADGTGARGRAVVRRGRAVVTVRLALPYPADLAALCAAVRRHVAARTALLTGIPVASVRVRVDRLVPEERSARRVR
ncbi:hypothetical protein ACWGJ2_38865 [Streptomyces sp. NPDC054796]